jgi:hypothetical protein
MFTIISYFAFLKHFSAEDQLNGMMPMFETMLESLLSKVSSCIKHFKLSFLKFDSMLQELMYPAIRQLAEKFPDWLADNRGALTDKLYQNHNKQVYSLENQVNVDMVFDP